MEYQISGVPERNKKESLKFLDGLRGLAALYVMIGHARWLLWEGGDGYNDHPGMYSTLDRVQVYFFSFFKYGHQMVLFFFVLSGFVIHLKQARALKSQKDLSMNDYFLRRARRIIPPVLFALLITYCCDKLVEHIGGSIFSHTTPNEIINRNIGFDHSLPTLFGNLLFVQETYTPVFGSNGPLWSLKYEWWFYMLYPLLLLLNRKTVLGSLILVLIVSVLAIGGWSWGVKLLDDVFAYLFCWWLGCFAADIYCGRIKVPSYVFYIFLVCLVTIPFQFRLPFGKIVADTVVALGFWALLCVLLKLHSSGISFSWLQKIKALGDSSYTLYVIHMPLLVLGHAFLLKMSNNEMPQTFAYIWLSIILILPIAYLMHFVVEKPFTRPLGSSKVSTAKQL